MNPFKSSSLGLLLALAISGCVAAPESNTDASEAPVVLNESSTGLSVAASSAAVKSAGVMHWELEANKPVFRVRGYDADGKLLSDMSFEQRPDKTGTVVENLSHESLAIDANGAVVKDQFSVKNRQVFSALSADATALRSLRAPSAPAADTTKALEGQPCSTCYGIFLLCGEWEFSVDNWGLLECDAQELCGACFGWGW